MAHIVTLEDANIANGEVVTLEDMTISSSTPSDPTTTNLRHWHEADYGIVLDGSNNVSTWTGKHLAAFTLNQTNASLRPPAPVTDSGIKNLYAIDFAGSYSLVSTLTANDRHLFMVFKQDSWTAAQSLLTALFGVSQYAAGITPEIAIPNGTGGYITTALATLGSWYFLELQYTGAALNVYLYDLDGTILFQSEGVVATLANATVLVGVADIKLAMLLGYTALLSESDRQDVITYIVGKYGAGSVGLPATQDDAVPWEDNSNYKLRDPY